jgi:hypothetical protein
MNRRITLVLMLSLALFPLTRAENEVGFIETFAFAEDREATLSLLVPGTEESYFFRSLHYQNTRQREKLGEVLRQWAARFPKSERRKVIERRESLLTYETDPQKTLQFLRDELRPRLDHVQLVPDQKPNLPSSIDPKSIERSVFAEAALATDDLQGMDAGAIDALISQRVPLRPAQRRTVLGRVDRPDLPGLTELLIEDLKSPESKGFGEWPIHRRLLPNQLAEVVRAVPTVARQTAFVRCQLSQLAPTSEEDVRPQSPGREAWLDRLLTAVRPLPPTFNSLKACVLYARLEYDRSRGVYSRERFVEYLKLPRPVSYVSPALLERSGGNQALVNLGADFAEYHLGLPPIRRDEPLVRDYLLHFAVDDADWQPWTEWLSESWVKSTFAEAKITSGVGDPEKWASLLPASAYQALRDRVDIDFSPVNPVEFAPADAVSLRVHLKNTPKLIVKIFELNTLNLASTLNRKPDTDLNLDGLVANSEQTYELEPVPFRRTTREFKFPELQGKRGAWIIELIGGGKSSRALIRKGGYHLVQRLSPGGDLLTIFDESFRPATNAVAWLDGRQWNPNPKTGEILIPFSQQAAHRNITLASLDGGFATLAQFHQHSESYRLHVDFHLEREQLLASRTATLLARTTLLTGDTILPPELLEDPKLTLTTVTLDGVTTTQEIPATGLTANRVFTHSFPVSDRLAHISAHLSARISYVSRGGKKEELSDSREWNINGIDATDNTQDAHLGRFDEGYVVDLLGKNGEPIVGQQITFDFTHHGFSQTQSIPLQTDDSGRLHLGHLSQIEQVTGHLPEGTTRTWVLPHDEVQLPSVIHAAAGDLLRLPWDGGTNLASVSLLEHRNDVFLPVPSAKLQVVGTFLEVGGLAPGDYSLRFRNRLTAADIAVHISSGHREAGWLLSPARFLEATRLSPLLIESVAVGTNELTVQLRNANPFTRVHVAGTRFVAQTDLSDSLGDFPRPSPQTMSVDINPSRYAAGREIGDEYRYILERRYAAKFPGNLLERPSLLLNPWERRETETAALSARSASDMASNPTSLARMATPGLHANSAGLAGMPDRTPDGNIDFLATTAPLLANLIPDAEGRVRIPRNALGDRQQILIYSEDLESAARKFIDFPAPATQFRDLRVAHSLDHQKSFSQHREVTLLKAGDTLQVTDLANSDVEFYDSLKVTYALLSSLSHETNLPRFAWIVDWPSLKDEEKRSKYSEFASHELNFFLSRKDPDFFRRVVQPYLRNKKELTFLDEYLLERPLEGYLEPTRFRRLNAAEQALLGQRLPESKKTVQRRLRELWELLPVVPEDEARRFEAGLRGRTLETDSTNGFDPDSPLKVKAPLNITPLPGSAAGVALGGLPILGRLANAEMVLESRTNGRAEDKLSLKEDGNKLADGNPSTFNYFGLEESEGFRRSAGKQPYYRGVDGTKEWAENNYYQVALRDQGPGLIPVNGFWVDLAEWDGKAPFLSKRITEATHSFAEIMLALGVLDLPFSPAKHAHKTESNSLTLTAGSPLIVFLQELRAASPATNAIAPTILVSESFFQNGDRYREVGNERFDKYVSGEFLSGVVYGAHVVLSNPGSAPAKLDILTQIPSGALPVGGSKATQSRYLHLEPYATEQLEYHFYFPAPGTNSNAFAHYPVTLTSAGQTVGAAKATSFQVVRKLSRPDIESWDYISQNATDAEVLGFLEQQNLERMDLEKIAWRARGNPEFFRKMTAFLARNHVWNAAILPYGLVHNDVTALRTWLRGIPSFLSSCGPSLTSPLLEFDSFEQHQFEHLEFSPIVNQRIHRLGSEHRIANLGLLKQYRSFLENLSFKASLSASESLEAVYFLLVQDRIEEAIARFHRLQPDKLATRLQYDYLRCYVDFYEEHLADARGLASQYADYPVDRWRTRFAEVTAQLDEIEGKKGNHPAGAPDRDRQQAELASAAPGFTFQLDDRKLRLNWKNLRDVTIHYYLMDPELLFSSSPFVGGDPGRFSIIRPTLTQRQSLPEQQDTMEVPLPSQFAQANVLIEVLGAGQRQVQAFHAHTFKLNVAETFGQLDVRDQTSDKPISKAYVKAYARLKTGEIRFLKDGYTDLRGKFDYASVSAGNSSRSPGTTGGTGGLDAQALSANELGNIDRISILVLSDTHGAAVREVQPPKS